MQRNPEDTEGYCCQLDNHEIFIFSSSWQQYASIRTNAPWWVSSDLVSKWCCTCDMDEIFYFYAPRNGIWGHLVFVLSVCLSVCYSVVKKNFNLGHNFWTVRDRDFIFGTHTQLMKPVQMTPWPMTLWPWPWSLF